MSYDSDHVRYILEQYNVPVFDSYYASNKGNSVETNFKQYNSNPFVVAYNNSRTYKFAVFQSIEQFIFIYTIIPLQIRSFFNVFSSSRRSLYIDIDFQTECLLYLNISQQILQRIGHIFRIFFTKYRNELKFSSQYTDNQIASHFSLYNQTRMVSNKRLKLSFHILNNYIQYSQPNDLHNDLQLFQSKYIKLVASISNSNIWKLAITILSSDCIDYTVYNNDHYQLLRMPYSIKLNDMNSVKNLIYPPNLSLIQQIKMNQSLANCLPIKSIQTQYTNEPSLLVKSAPLISKQRRKTSQFVEILSIKYNQNNSCVCNSSINTILHGQYKSKLNNTIWEETFCYNCNTLFKCRNHTLKIKQNSRIYANIDLSCNQIEYIHQALLKFKIHIDNYHYIFHAIHKNTPIVNVNNSNQICDKQIKVKFSSFIRGICKHNLSFMIIHLSETMAARYGAFSIYCTQCKWFNLNDFM